MIVITSNELYHSRDFIIPKKLNCTAGTSQQLVEDDRWYELIIICGHLMHEITYIHTNKSNQINK